MNIRTHYTHTHMHSQRGMKYKEVSMIRKMIKGLHMAELFCFDSLFISFCTFHHSPSFFPLLSRSVHITLAATAYLRSQLAAPMQGKSFRIIFLELHHWQLEHWARNGDGWKMPAHCVCSHRMCYLCSFRPALIRHTQRENQFVHSFVCTNIKWIFIMQATPVYHNIYLCSTHITFSAL